MVDLHENHRNDASQKNRDGKVKNLMDRTPSFIKSKILSVLGSSNDLISGITTKLEGAVYLSSSSDTNSNDHDTNRNSSTNRTDDVSLDENIIDFESRKVKERRALDEVSTGRYRHPNFVTSLAFEDCNMIDVNPESSLSVSNSNSMISKSPTSLTTATDDGLNCSPSVTAYSESQMAQKSSTAAVKCGDSLNVQQIGSGASASPTEMDSRIPSISQHSAVGLKLICHSESNYSAASWGSIISLDSPSEDEALEFMRRFVSILFEDSFKLTLELKSEFGEKSRTEAGRLWFARLVSAQRSHAKRVNENTFYSLVQHFAIVLFECGESDDFSPAKILMNMCFTFYYEVDVPGCEPYREYLYTYLRDQPIWHALRFWNAAFFDAVQCERSHRPIPHTHPLPSPRHESTDDDEMSSGANSVQRHLAADVQTNLALIRDDQIFQQNISFGQLGTFTCNMHAFGLSQELCVEFLRKQCVIANLGKEQQKMLYDNINRMYKETAKWRKK